MSEIRAGELREATAGTDVDRMFVDRWSPRAMSGMALSLQQVQTLLEAARWAPSCFNAQPWRFAFVLKDSRHWPDMLNTLLEGNRQWAQRAGALIAVITRREYEHNGKPAPTAGFDAGAAWMSLALQAQRMGLIAHGMQGFDQAQLRAALSVPYVYDTPAVVALGYPGDVDELPEGYREREQPSGRKPLEQIMFEGGFGELAE